jgi:hypothetical protein
MKTVLTVIAIIALACSLIAGFSNHDSVLWVAFLSFLALLLFANLDRIAVFKASKSGFEAQTREITRVVDEAKSTIKELQDLAQIVAATTLSLVQRSGRLGGYTDTEKHEVKQSILRLLTQLGLTEEDRKGVLFEWHSWEELDYVFYILGGNTIPRDFDEKQVQEWKALRARARENRASPDELRAFLKKHQRLNDDRDELIRDYEFYIEHRQHRRPDVWAKRFEVERL